MLSVIFSPGSYATNLFLFFIVILCPSFHILYDRLAFYLQKRGRRQEKDGAPTRDEFQLQNAFSTIYHQTFSN